METSFQLTEKEVVLAMKLDNKPTSLSMFIFTAILGGLVGFWLAKSDSFYFALAIAYLFLLLSMYFIIVPYRAKKHFKQNKQLHKEIKIALTEQGLKATNSNGNMFLEWKDIFQWKSNNKLHLIYTTSNMFHIIPIRAFQDKADELLGLLVDQIGSKKV